MPLLACWLNARAFATAEKRDKTLTALLDGHFDTAILFGPKFGGHPGYGTPEAFEAFSRMVRDAGLAVHVWLNCSRLTPYPNFTDATTRAAYANWAAAVIAEYDPDGIHLDYIRYDKSNAPSVAMEAVAITVRTVREAIGDKQLSASQFPLDAAWEERYKDPPNWPHPVPEWFKRWYAGNPGSVYHSATSPQGRYVGIPKYMRYQQNGLEWPLDMLMPMEYTSDPNTWKQRVDLWHSHHLAAECRAELVMGIQTRPNADPAKSDGLLPADLVDCVQYARDRGVGACLFQIGSWNDEQFIRALSALEPLPPPPPPPDIQAVITHMQARAANLSATAGTLHSLVAELEHQVTEIETDLALLDNAPPPDDPLDLKTRSK